MDSGKVAVVKRFERIIDDYSFRITGRSSV
jgi:hypothetical protein